MLARLYRRLVGRLAARETRPAPDAGERHRVAGPAHMLGSDVQTPAETSVVAEGAELPPIYDASAAWDARLENIRAVQVADAELSGNPDATALLQLLAEGPESVIRQLPAAAYEALALCDDPTISRAQLATGLSRDPVLVQGLLRTANSVAMGGTRGSILSIGQAVDRIGVSGARAVVLTSCVDGLLSNPGGEYTAMANDVWSHMVRTAPMAKAVASAFAADPDEAFAIALLHDVGKLIIFDRISTLRSRRRRNITLPMSFVHQLLQALHEPLGALAVGQWGMGDRAAGAIGTHHRGAATPTRDSLAEVIFLAEHADHAMRRAVPLEMDLLWATGRLTGSPARAASALQHHLSAA